MRMTRFCILGEGSLSYWTCAQPQLYFCTIKLCSNQHLTIFHFRDPKWTDDEGICCRNVNNELHFFEGNEFGMYYIVHVSNDVINYTCKWGKKTQTSDWILVVLVNQCYSYLFMWIIVTVVLLLSFPDTIKTKLHMQKISTFALASSGPPYHIAGYVPGSKVRCIYKLSHMHLYYVIFLVFVYFYWIRLFIICNCEPALVRSWDKVHALGSLNKLTVIYSTDINCSLSPEVFL